MNRLNYNADSSFEDVEKCFREYREYLHSIKPKIPESAFNFAVADWHYDRNDPRCPQRANIESLTLVERVLPESSEITTEIAIRVLPLKKNGAIEIFYKGVIFYSLQKTPFLVRDPESNKTMQIFNEPTTTHADWVIDEIHLSDEKFVVHTIELAFSAKWIIHSSDILYKFTPG